MTNSGCFGLGLGLALGAGGGGPDFGGLLEGGGGW
jgi:hypothetical protein